MCPSRRSPSGASPHLSGKLTLKALNIDGSATSDDGLASVADMPNLEMLWAAGTQITVRASCTCKVWPR